MPDNMIKNIKIQKEYPKTLEILCKHNGEVIEWKGDISYFFEKKIEEKMKIDCLNAFSGIFPCRHKELYLPNIQTRENIWANISIEKKENNIYVLLTDNTVNAKKLKEKALKRNISLLNKTGNKDDKQDKQ